MRRYLILTIVLSIPDTVAAGDGDNLRLEIPPQESQITVLATAERELIARLAQPVSIITASEIDRIQGPNFTRILERLPSATFSRNGGLGGFTGLSVRGGSADQLLVLIDGVRVADAAAPAGGFDFGGMLAGTVGKVELLRGPNSVVWGADALAGVISITTRNPPDLLARVEAGTDRSFDAVLGTRYASGPVELDLIGSLHSGEGFSAAEGGSENDGFRQWQLAGKARIELARGLTLSGNARHAEGQLEIDGFPAPDYVLADTDEEQHSRERSGRVSLRFDSDLLMLDAGWSASAIAREYFDPSMDSTPYYRTDGSSRRADMRGRLRPSGPNLAFDFGLSRDWSQFDDEGTERDARLAGVHALLGWYGDRITAAAGLRRDDHSTFGGAWSIGANGGYRFAPGWRIRAGYGEGFKPPSLFQSSSALYGNPGLQPERSRAWDIGIEHGVRRRGTYLAVSAFRRDSRDLINYTCCSVERPFGTYENVGEARAEGIEFEAGADLASALRLQGVYSHVAATDRTPGGANEGNDLARRPRHSATISLDWSRNRGVSLGADLRVVSGSFDDATNLVPLNGYAVLTLRGSVAVADRIELFGRIENVWDEQYQTVAGYGTQGRAAWIGARAAW